MKGVSKLNVCVEVNTQEDSDLISILKRPYNQRTVSFAQQSRRKLLIEFDLMCNNYKVVVSLL